jgi:uncharacterized protein (TIGR03437 family)
MNALIANYKRQFLVTPIVLSNISPDLASLIPPPPKPPGKITLSPSRADNFYDEGENVQAKIESDPGFFFIAWSGTVQSTATPLDFTVSGPQTIIANIFQKRRLSFAGVVSAASLQPGPIAPGQAVSIYGLKIGPKKPATMQVRPDGTIDTLLSNTRVLVDGIAVPMLYASQNKVTAVMPFNIAGLTMVNIEVEFKGKRTNPQLIPVVSAAPSLFTEGNKSSDPLVVFNDDGSRNSSDNPASRGSAVIFTATGLGQTDPEVPEGKVNSDPLPKPVLPIRLIIGGIEAHIESVRGVPGESPGIMQITARIPEAAAIGGRIQVILVAGGIFSQLICTLAIK